MQATKKNASGTTKNSQPHWTQPHNILVSFLLSQPESGSAAAAAQLPYVSIVSSNTVVVKVKGKTLILNTVANINGEKARSELLNI